MGIRRVESRRFGKWSGRWSHSWRWLTEMERDGREFAREYSRVFCWSFIQVVRFLGSQSSLYRVVVVLCTLLCSLHVSISLFEILLRNHFLCFLLPHFLSQALSLKLLPPRIFRSMSTSTTPSRAQRGALIIFEGLDRSGKSTQVGKLYERLQSEGRKVKKIGFPGEWFFILSRFIREGQEEERETEWGRRFDWTRGCLKGLKAP